MKPSFVLGLVLFCLSCGSDDTMNRIDPPSPEKVEPFAIEFLDSIQDRTFEAEREFCGYFGLDTKNELAASPPSRGQADSCLPPEPDALSVFASYHSHGAYDDGADSEVPSVSDLEADIAEGVDGYIGTPGGRVWLNDSADEIAYLICEDCILADTDYDPDAFAPVEESYTIDELRDRFATD